MKKHKTKQNKTKQNKNRGPYHIEEWMEMLGEANANIRSLQFQKRKYESAFNNTIGKLEALIATQKQESICHQADISKLSSDHKQETQNYENRINELVSLKNELKNSYDDCVLELGQIKTNNDELQSKLHTITQQNIENLEKIKNENNKCKNENGVQSQTMNQCGDITDAGFWKEKAFALEAQVMELKLKYEKELRERRKLYNELQDIRGNIRVFARARPLLPKEEEKVCFFFILLFLMDGM